MSKARFLIKTLYRDFTINQLCIFLLCFVSIIPFLGYDTFNYNFVSFDLSLYNLFFTSWFYENFGVFNIIFNTYEMIFLFISRFIGYKYSLVLYFSFLQFFAGFYFYKLIFYLFKDYKIALVSSLFYILSINAQFMSLWGIYYGGIVYSSLPFFIYHLSKINDANFYLTFAKLAIIYSFFNVVNLTYILYFELFILFFIFIRYQFDGFRFKFLLKIIFVNFFIFILTLSPFLMAHYFQNLYDTKLVSFSLDDESVDWKSSASRIEEVIRGLGSVNFEYTISQYHTYPNARFMFENLLIVFLSYVPFLVFLLSILFFKDNKKYLLIKLYLLLFYLLLIFLGLGTNKTSYSRLIYEFISNKIPFFSVLRDTFKVTYIINFIYAFSVGYFLKELSSDNHFKKIYKYVFLGFIFTIFLLSFNYLFTPFFKYEVIKIPNYWEELRVDYSNNFNSRILTSPYRPADPSFKFVSKYRSSSGFYRSYLKLNNISPGKLYRFRDTSKFLYNNPAPELFSLYGIKNILNIEDDNYSYIGVPNPNEYRELLINKRFRVLKKYE